MKSLIPILLLFCSFASYSQTSFSDTLEGNGKRIILKKDNCFEYSFKIDSMTYPAQSEAKGIYNFHNNKLILVFDDPKQSNYTIISPPAEPPSPSFPSTFNVQNINCDSLNKINLNFQVVNQDNKPLTGATILLLGLGKGANVKKDGSAKIGNIEKNKNITVNISYIGYESFKFKLYSDSSKFIKVVMSNLEHETICLSIVLNRKKRLIFDISDKIQNENCNYLINKNKTMMLFEDYTDYFE